MNTQHVSGYEPSERGFTGTNLRTDIRQEAGPWREFILWLLLAAFLLMVFADGAYAADRRIPARTRSPDAGVPTYNVEAICRGAASIARLLETTAPDNAQNCREDEHHAREQLLQQWTQFDAADRVMCDGAAQSGAVEPTYTELMTCLEMTRDNLNRQASAHVAQHPDQATAPVAVAAAPVRGTGLIRNALAGR